MRTLSRSALFLLYLGGCGSDDLFITADLGPDEDCEYAAIPSLAWDRVVYDVATGGTPDSDACADPYVAHLLAENPNSDTVLVKSAEVKLVTVQEQTLAFRDPTLPNPFLTTVASHLPGERSGIAAVEVIPLAYASALSDFVGGNLVAHITLFGTTSSDGEVESNRFSLPIAVCDGCRTLCRKKDIVDDEIPEPECSDFTLGVGRLWCIDPDC